MAWKESHKAESRQRILVAAADLFTRKGFNQVGIDEVMLAAGLTRGAFYAHFNSKIDLYEEAILSAGIAATQHFNNGATDIHQIIENYLSEEHLHSTHIRCPMACLVNDVAHDDERV
jgi:TetR/AcrR family transcriptional repressor of nem operon